MRGGAETTNMALATHITRTATLAAAMAIVTALIVATASATTRSDVLDTTGECMMTRATRDKTEATGHGHRGVARG